VIERPTNFGHAFGPESGLDAVEHLERRRLCSRVSREAVRGYERIVEEEVMREIATRSFTPAGVGSGAERQSVDRLRRHPQLLRLVNEADAGGSELRQVTIFEGQRTRSTIEASLRRAKKRIRLGDCALPEGTHVMVNSHLAHESEESFPDAGSFVPIPRQQCVREHGDGRRPAHTAARISFRATGIGGVGPQALYPPRSAARARTTDTISPPLVARSYAIGESDRQNYLEVLRWICEQPWCNGDLAATGASYGALLAHHRRITADGSEHPRSSRSRGGEDAVRDVGLAVVSRRRTSPSGSAR
jgi:X-Pro dipeptidyl-peptidase (S15 family)/Cytochrome P450